MRLAIIAIAVSLCGCATQYQAKGLTGGFSEVRLNETTYKINVEGNGYTTTDRASNIALLRGAELTLQAGYERFTVTASGAQQNSAGSTPVVTNFLNGGILTTGGQPITKPTGDLTITMVRKTDPAYATAYDAKLISEQLRQQLGVQG